MKVIKAAIVCLISVVLLASCGKTDRPSAKNPVTLTIWHTYVEQMGEEFRALVDEFNSTVGAADGISIDIASVSNADELNERLMDAANGVPGAPKIPDMAVLYPKIAVLLANKGMLLDFDEYFTEEDCAKFVSPLLEEGRLGGDALYLLPVAKSTEVLYVNRTVFDRFAGEVGADISQLSTFEGIVELAAKYYDWTDAQTPDVSGDGKAFYYSDNSFNLTAIWFEQLGEDFIKDGQMDLQSASFERMWNIYYPLMVRGGFAIFNKYGNYLAMTGDAVCISSTSAGAIYYPDSVTYADNTKEDVEFEVLPYPVSAGGEKVVMQRGGGICVLKSEPKKEYAASVFLKWLTGADVNFRFGTSTGYMPVITDSFEQIREGRELGTDNENIQKMLKTAVGMKDGYRFYIPPVFDYYDTIVTEYNKQVYEQAKQDRERYLKLIKSGEAPDSAWATVSEDSIARLQQGLA